MTTRSLFSPLWHRVEGVRLKVKPGVAIERQVVRGAIWYVVRDPASAAAHRVSAPVYALLMRMDGTRSLERIWDEVAERFGEEAPSQDDVIQAVSQLYVADVVQTASAVDGRELSERAHTLRRRQWLQRYQNPLFFRLGLFNPDRFLDATVHLVRPLFSVPGLVLWLAAAAWLLAQAAIHWDPLTRNIADRILAPENLVVTMLIFPLIKIVHELGHAYATKAFGGEVPEIGVMFLVLTPAPYVDASSSALFPRKGARMIVGLAGIMAEILLAAAAMAVWTHAEAGPVRAVAFNVMLIAGVSTLVFNGNPLLRFDAYYVLSDWLEIPNLYSRSGQYWSALVQRRLFGVGRAASPVTAPGEAFWFALYAPLACVYRFVVVGSLALFLGSRFFVFGVLLALLAVMQSVVWPLVKALRFVLVSPALAGHRLRATLLTGFAAGAVVVALGVVPVPHGTVAEGVVWVPDGAQVFAGTNGGVARVLRPPGSAVAAGEPLFLLDDPYAVGLRRLAAARLSELRDRLSAAETTAPVEIELVRRRIEYAEGDLAEAERRLGALTVKSPSAGIFVVPRGVDIAASYAAKGTLLGYVMPAGRPMVRVAVPEAEIDTVRGLTRAVALRLSEAGSPARTDVAVVREVPGATRRLPSPALATTAGGPFALDTSAKAVDTSLTPFFEIDVATEGPLAPDRWGERVHVRFDHGATPFAAQLYRRLRQVFLAHFDV